MHIMSTLIWLRSLNSQYEIAWTEQFLKNCRQNFVVYLFGALNNDIKLALFKALQHKQNKILTLKALIMTAAGDIHK